MTGQPNHKTCFVAIANQKGGVGKTTTAINLAAGLAMLRQRILVVDCDAQANATSGLGISPGKDGRHLYHVLTGGIRIRDAITPARHANLFLLPSHTDLVGIEIELAGREERENGTSISARTSSTFLMWGWPRTSDAKKYTFSPPRSYPSAIHSRSCDSFRSLLGL